MKRYIRSNRIVTDYEYGYYNDTVKDRAHFIDKFKSRGALDVKVRRTRSDTPGLKMYEIEIEVPDGMDTSQLFSSRW